MEDLFKKIHLSGFTLTGSCHLAGLFLIKTTKSDLPNQVLLTSHLALAELLGSWYQVIDCSRQADWDHADAFFDVFVFVVVRLIVLLIILDRFLDIKFSLKYSMYITKRRLFGLVCSLWTFSAMLASILTQLSFKNNITLTTLYVYLSFIMLCLDIVIFVVTTVTYFHLHTLVKRVKRRKSVGGQIAEGKTWCKFIIPCLMAASHLLLNATGTVLKVIMNLTTLTPTQNAIYVGVFGMLDFLGWLSDAFIYTFLQRRIREKLKSILRRFCCCKNQTELITSSDTPTFV